MFIFKYHQMILEKIFSTGCYEQVGRPKKTVTPTRTIYQIEAHIASLFLERRERLMHHSCYVIGTNAEENELSSEDIIDAYKNQNASVERGFRFLKDPQFFVSSFFSEKASQNYGIVDDYDALLANIFYRSETLA